MQNSLPPPVARLDAASFRRKLAGLPEQIKPATFAGLRDAAVDLAYTMAIVFNRDKLDAVTLWDRIASGIDAAASRVDDGDMDVFLTSCFKHVCADMTRVVSSVEACEFMAAMVSRDEAWRIAFVRYLRQIQFTVIPLARAKWQARQAAMVEQREAVTA